MPKACTLTASQIQNPPWPVFGIQMCLCCVCEPESVNPFSSCHMRILQYGIISWHATISYYIYYVSSMPLCIFDEFLLSAEGYCKKKSSLCRSCRRKIGYTISCYFIQVIQVIKTLYKSRLVIFLQFNGKISLFCRILCRLIITIN